MNKTAIAILAVFAFAAAALTGVAVAGINPVNFGLPTVALATGDNNFYNLTVAAVPGQQASVMCVACHSRNPGSRDLYRTTNGFSYMGSHFVTQFFSANETSKGGGYTDGSGTKARATRGAAGATAIYMADNTSGNMTVANGWYARPKYGVNAGIPDNTYLPRTATSPQLICESCHNIVGNIGPAKLLAYGMANGTATSGTSGAAKGSQVPVLCIGCHGDMDASLNAEWQLHPLVSDTWVGTQHHRNTAGATPPLYLGAGADIPAATHDMGIVNAAYYGAPPLTGQQINGGSNQMWAPGRGQLGTAAYADHALNFAPTGNTRMKPMADNNQVQPNAAAQLLCTNCHRAHNADSSAGATILLRGSDTATAMGTGTIASSVATAYYGLRRMEDKGGRAAAFNSTNPLCLACHL